MMYVYIILIFNVLITALNLCLPSVTLPWWGVVLSTLGSTVAVILVDGLFAFAVRRLPEKWFSPDKKIFDVSRRELRFYGKLHIRAWKDKVPELGVFTGFHKNRVAKPEDNEYLRRFLLESNYGAVGHLCDALFGYLIIFFLPLSYAPTIGVPVATVNAVLNLMPMFILRYHTPKLKALCEINRRSEIRKKEASEMPTDNR